MNPIAQAFGYVAALAALLVGCTNSLTPENEKDLALVGKACINSTKGAEQAECITALVRLTGKAVPNSALPKPPPTPSVGVAKEEITFKGIPFNQPGQLDRVLQLCDKKENSYDGDKCKKLQPESGRFSFFLQYGTLYMFNLMGFQMDSDGRLQAVDGSPSSGQVPNLVNSLSMKYGPPLIEESIFQTVGGAKYPNKTSSWIDAKGTQILITEHKTKLGDGSIEISSKSNQDAIALRRAQSLSSASKNL